MRDDMSDRRRQHEQYLVIQTPVGLLKIAIGPGVDLPEPVARAVDIFRRAVSSGSHDPMGETLEKLQQMALLGDEEPLAASMAYINEQMARQLEEFKRAREQGQEGIITRLEKPAALN